jgi:hypothetical protein
MQEPGHTLQYSCFDMASCVKDATWNSLTDVAAAPAAINVGMVDAGEGKGTGTGGGDVVGRGGEVVFGATVEAADEGAADENGTVADDDGAGAADDDYV